MGEAPESHIPPVIGIGGHYWHAPPEPGDRVFRRTTRGFLERHPEVVPVWLEARCDACGYAERLYCDDEVWDGCEGSLGHSPCGRRPVPYRPVGEGRSGQEAR